MNPFKISACRVSKLILIKECRNPSDAVSDPSYSRSD